MLTDVARLFGPTVPRMAAASSPTPTGVAPSVVCGEVHGCRRCRAVTGLNTIPDAITAMEPFRVVALAGLENSPSSGRTLTRRRADILAYFTHRAPNGPTEAMNGRLEALRRTPSASETSPTTESDHCCTAATIPERSMKLKPEAASFGRSIVLYNPCIARLRWEIAGLRILDVLGSLVGEH